MMSDDTKVRTLSRLPRQKIVREFAETTFDFSSTVYLLEKTVGERESHLSIMG